ncbi:MAG: UDP-N-acetylmuramate dehydrogenase, partial [Vicinamibacterales bacterium]
VEGLAWARTRHVPVHVLGGGSNVVVADQGFDGLVIHVDIRGVARAPDDGRETFSVGAGEPWDPFVAATVAAGCAGLECLSGIPGQVGGTPVQNVGAYGQDVSGSIIRVHVVDRETQTASILTADECGFGYRTSRFKHHDRFIVSRVEFALVPDGPPTLAYADVITFFDEAGNSRPSLLEVRDAILGIRRRKGMVIEDGNPANRSVGSFFVNPIITREHYARLSPFHEIDWAAVPHYRVGADRVKVPAAWLIERAGFPKGFTRGPIGVSPFQAQAILNHGGARALDVLTLAADIKHAVWQAFEIALVPEPIFVGFKAVPDLQWLLDAQPKGEER